MVHGHGSSVRFVSLTYVPFDQDGARSRSRGFGLFAGRPFPPASLSWDPKVP